MAYIKVPTDLSKIKSKLVFGLTKRQILCFGTGLGLAVPTYLATNNAIGGSLPVLLLGFIIMPFAFFGMYERDGLPAEKYMFYRIRKMFVFPKKRLYKQENRFVYLESTGKSVERMKVNGSSNGKTANPTRRKNKKRQEKAGS